MSWMKNGSHGIAEKKKSIIMTKNGKQATITKSEDEYLEMNDYCEQRYRLFLKQWLEQGQDFLFELMAMGMISVKRNRQQIGLMGGGEMSWISVKDKLPNDLDNVDLLINAKRRLTDCTYTDDRFYTHQCKDEYWKEIKNNVTHWMLVPELPKDES